MTIVDNEHVDLPTLKGPMRTYVFRPKAGGRYPGIIFFSEIFQVTGPIRRTAMWLAGQGYVVAVPEVYHEFEAPGVVLAYDQAGADRGNALKTTKELGSYDADARAALDHLKSRSDCTGKLGALGICLGGHLAFRAGLNADVRGTACFYATDIHKRSLAQGMNDNTLDRMTEIKGEMLMIWGLQDPHIPRDGRRIIYDAMTDAGMNFTWHEFNGQHAFMRDEGPRYDPALAHVCQTLLLEFFHRRLGEGDFGA